MAAEHGKAAGRRVSTLVAEAVESIDGVVGIMEDVAESPGLPPDLRARLWAARDSALACRDRVEAIDSIVNI